MSERLKSVCIVGGGSAGWLAAAVIAARHRAGHPDDIEVTLIESEAIGILGVGEGTWPTMRNTLRKIGVSETEFFRDCNVSFKQGAKFAGWATGATDDFYYHPLVLPEGFPSLDLAAFWNHYAGGNEAVPSFSDAVCFQEAVCEKGLAPKLITTPEYGCVANYAYHLDANKFAAFLKKHCVEKLGVRHVVDEVERVALAESGDISHLVTARNGDLSADLFVDCTGFHALLIGKALGVPFRSCQDVLFIDRALAVQVPYATPDQPIVPHTVSTAQSNGWIWDIGLQNRRGVGYVYSSAHSTKERAEAELAAYVGPAIDTLQPREIRIQSGHREQFWKGNCVAVGLSAGFLEPLEASALVLIELSVEMISAMLPATRETMAITARRFNQVTLYRWDRIIDFLKLHYSLSRRSDSAFWRDNRDPASIPDSLKEQLALWRYRAPGDQDFSSNSEMFPAASYQYVLFGMGFKMDLSGRSYQVRDGARAEEAFRRNVALKEKWTRTLPRNRELIDKILEYGMARV
jgi:glycine/D-amino acid oxidase-like deaminating enzyme